MESLSKFSSLEPFWWIGMALAEMFLSLEGWAPREGRGAWPNGLTGRGADLYHESEAGGPPQGALWPQAQPLK